MVLAARSEEEARRGQRPQFWYAQPTAESTHTASSTAEALAQLLDHHQAGLGLELPFGFRPTLSRNS